MPTGLTVPSRSCKQVKTVCLRKKHRNPGSSFVALSCKMKTFRISLTCSHQIPFSRLNTVLLNNYSVTIKMPQLHLSWSKSVLCRSHKHIHRTRELSGHASPVFATKSCFVQRHRITRTGLPTNNPSISFGKTAESFQCDCNHEKNQENPNNRSNKHTNSKCHGSLAIQPESGFGRSFNPAPGKIHGSQANRGFYMTGPGRRFQEQNRIVWIRVLFRIIQKSQRQIISFGGRS